MYYNIYTLYVPDNDTLQQATQQQSYENNRLRHRGSPWHAKPEHRYALGFKCMGAFIGQPHWAAQRTRSALEAHLEPLSVVTQLGDVEQLRNSLQCKSS